MDNNALRELIGEIIPFPILHKPFCFPICIIWWAERDLNPQRILRAAFTALLRQPVCISAQVSTGGGIRTHTILTLDQTPHANWATPVFSLYCLMLFIALP